MPKPQRFIGPTFGPIVVLQNDGSLLAKCDRCKFRWGTNQCGWAKEPRHIPDISNTPDWCVMKADMLREAAEYRAAEISPSSKRRRADD